MTNFFFCNAASGNQWKRISLQATRLLHGRAVRGSHSFSFVVAMRHERMIRPIREIRCSKNLTSMMTIHKYINVTWQNRRNFH